MCNDDAGAIRPRDKRPRICHGEKCSSAIGGNSNRDDTIAMLCMGQI